MSRVIIRHPDGSLGGIADIKTNMPSVSCGVCGQIAQIPVEALGVDGAKHWDHLYDGDRGPDSELAATMPPRYSRAQWDHDRELESWSQEHAKTHTQVEHDEAARKAGVA